VIKVGCVEMHVFGGAPVDQVRGHIPHAIVQKAGGGGGGGGGCSAIDKLSDKTRT
jgi:hypothetical protein